MARDSDEERVLLYQAKAAMRDRNPQLAANFVWYAAGTVGTTPAQAPK